MRSLISSCATGTYNRLLSWVALPNSFDGAHSIALDHSRPHGQTSLPVPPGITRPQAGHIPYADMLIHLSSAADHTPAAARRPSRR